MKVKTPTAGFETMSVEDLMRTKETARLTKERDSVQRDIERRRACVLGAAFGSITTSLVNDIFMPLALAALSCALRRTQRD